MTVEVEKMEFILEFIAEILLELLLLGGVEGGAMIATDCKKKRWTRYLALLFVIVLGLLYVGVVVAILWFGIMFCMEEKSLTGILVLGIGILLIVAAIKQGREVYQKVMEKRENREENV